ncbi:hypothetical protein TrVE_jg7509 [Triparma verrucosa]|uniref:Uncharacterized protein n=1 Tax=Triparma verrucosa TaxID=1606542 RepID=A0A9W7FHW6_9STRA|nr:hypothetical protein TrVE_jg7509 [Triparma verrucosa]
MSAPLTPAQLNVLERVLTKDQKDDLLGYLNASIKTAIRSPPRSAARGGGLSNNNKKTLASQLKKQLQTPTSAAYNDHVASSNMPGFRYENPHLPPPHTVTKVDYDHSWLPPPDHSCYQPDVHMKAEAARASALPADKHSYKLGLKEDDKRDTYLDPLGEPDHYEHREKTYYKRSPERIKAMTPKYEPPRLYEGLVAKDVTAPVAGIKTEHQPYKKGNIIEHRKLRSTLRSAPSHSNSTPDLLNPVPLQPPPPPTPSSSYVPPGWIESSSMKTLLSQDVYITGPSSCVLNKSETFLGEGGKKHLSQGIYIKGAAGQPTSSVPHRRDFVPPVNCVEEVGKDIYKGEYPDNDDGVGKVCNFKDQRFSRKFCESYGKNKESQIVFG